MHDERQENREVLALVSATETKQRHTERRKTDRQTDRRAGRRAGRQADRQTDRQTDRQIDTHTQTHRHTRTSTHTEQNLLSGHVLVEPVWVAHVRAAEAQRLQQLEQLREALVVLDGGPFSLAALVIRALGNPPRVHRAGLLVVHYLLQKMHM